ncbi:tetratricopeptide repeat protein [Methylosinus sp. LW3]|nr:tetratricopeptide repeat protein [Methylosinus sp. LW3]
MPDGVIMSSDIRSKFAYTPDHSKIDAEGPMSAPNPNSVERLFIGAKKLMDQAARAFERQDYARSKVLLLDALGDCEASKQSGHRDKVDILLRLALTEGKQGDLDESRESLRRALVVFEENAGTDKVEVAERFAEAAIVLHSLNERVDAKIYSKRALAIFNELLDEQHPEVLACLDGCVIIHVLCGNHKEAAKLLERALAYREQAVNVTRKDIAAFLDQFTDLFHTHGGGGEVEPFLRKALSIRETLLGPEHLHTLMTLNKLGLALFEKGAYTDAMLILERVYATCEKTMGSAHPDTATCLSNIGDLLCATGHLAEAQLWFEQAISVLERVLEVEQSTRKRMPRNLKRLNKSADQEEYSGQEGH